jgi:WD40 repeat protein
MTMAEPANQPAPDAAPAALKLEQQRIITLPAAVLGLDSAPDGKSALAACMDGGVYTIDIESGRYDPLGKHASYASGAKFIPGANAAVSAGYDGALQWYDLTAKQLIRRVEAHSFWSWKLAVSADGKQAASVTGQYLAGGYKYEPAAAREPTVKIFDAASGELRHGFNLIPPVLSVAFSRDGKFVAAGNLMGDLRVWDLASGAEAAAWNTPDFTSWGIIKSHHYVGGIFGVSFSPDGNELLACGMGPMKDPMAGNGKQTWQRFAWREKPVQKRNQIRDNDQGNGLMETLAWHPAGRRFVMAGRLAQGKWNLAAFDATNGELVASLDTKMRIAEAAFSADGQRLLLGSAVGQGKPEQGKRPDFGRIAVYAWREPA